MERYSIKDLEKLSGIKAHTIRVWERRYRIINPLRTDTNRRRYADDDLRRIINISILRRNGFKISNIARLTNSEIEEKVSFLSKYVPHSNTQIDSLIVSMIENNEKAVNDLLIRSIMNIGVEDTMTKVMFPFLERVGLMWQTGSVDVGSEHFISNIFRQRLISSIDLLSPVLRAGSKKVILFLPENELHEIGLLFFNYVIRREGHETLYLGQSTPLIYVERVNSKWNADIIITGLMTGFPDLEPEDFLVALDKSFPEKIILVAGLLEKAAVELKNPHIFPISSAEDLKSAIDLDPTEQSPLSSRARILAMVTRELMDSVSSPA